MTTTNLRIVGAIYYRFVTMPPALSLPLEAAEGELDQPTTLAPAASLFHSLSDTTRLALLRRLMLGEHRVVDLTTHLRLAQSTVSAHLACLRDCGLITSRPQGRASLFALNPNAERALRALLTAAEELLSVTGDAVDLCPTYGSARTKAYR